MQFIPGTWAAFGVDADGDGRADPQNVYDAAAKLAFTTAPSPTATSGTALTRQPVVTVQNAAGNTITTDTSP